MNKVVVVSGASSGIGFAIASHLETQGYTVYGLSRTTPKIAFRFNHLVTDVTKEDSIASAVQTILSRESRVDALINCAGMGISGAIEHTSMDSVQKMFDVNLFGMFQLTKTMIPALRESKGMILNVGSVAGVLTIPFQTFYSMSKSAVNAFSEGLRMELKPFGIRVSTILPGDTQTGFTAAREKNQIIDPLYQDRIQRSVSSMEKDEEQGMSPLSVAKVAQRLLKRKHLPVMVAVGLKYKLFVFLKRIVPARFVNYILYQMYGK